jgi:hypothetical protein
MNSYIEICHPEALDKEFAIPASKINDYSVNQFGLLSR